MDEARFDRWTRGLSGAVSRRGVSRLAAGALAALGLHAAEARKKKRKKGGKKKGKKPICPGGCQHNEKCSKGKCIDPACGECPSGQACIQGLCQDATCQQEGEDRFCTLGKACCLVEDASHEPTCTPFEYLGGYTENHCCMPLGATRRWWPSRYGCCGSNSDELPNGDRRCCIFNGYPDQGDPTLCCDREGSGAGESVNGLCCQPSGQHCTGPDLCCNGGGCPESRICP